MPKSGPDKALCKPEAFPNYPEFDPRIGEKNLAVTPTMRLPIR